MRKARIVAGGHKMDPPGKWVHSGVVPIDGVQLGLFLSVLNNMQSCAAHCGNAFLHGKTYEKYYIIVRPEFGNLAGRILLIDPSWYGLKTSAASWHDFFLKH